MQITHREKYVAPALAARSGIGGGSARRGFLLQGLVKSRIVLVTALEAGKSLIGGQTLGSNVFQKFLPQYDDGRDARCRRIRGGAAFWRAPTPRDGPLGQTPSAGSGGGSGK